MPFEPVPDGRKVHYLRIFATNKAGDVIRDQWLDMERIDELTTTTQDHGYWQEVVYKLRWFDEPDHDDPPESRKTRIVKYWDVTAYGPNEEDAEEWVPIDVVTEFETTSSDVTTIYKLLNDALTDFRVRQRRRWVHYDTSIDAQAEAALDADSTLKTYYAVADDYQKDEETRDEEDWVETEVILRHLSRASGQTGMISSSANGLEIAKTMSNGTDQERSMQLNNDYLISNSEESKLDGDVPPERRIDPFQNIVNTKVSALKQAVIGMPSNGFGSVPSTMITKDGQTFDTGHFGSSTFSGASGLGKTVVGNGTNIVAFGKPRDGVSCFIVVDGNYFGGTDTSIRRGVLDERGELKFTTIANFPAGGGSAYSCSFAGEAFFIQYNSPDGNDIHMAVSFDGETFRFGVKPFDGVNSPSVANPDDVAHNPAGAPAGGSVAYDKKNKRYVTTGSYTHWYASQFIIQGFEDLVINTFDVDLNFMSSVSRDGLSWTPKFDTSKGRGVGNHASGTTDIANDSAGPSTVCFSDSLGLFVASTVYKNTDQDLANAPGADSLVYPWYIECSGVATSTDGVSWTNKRIGTPGFIRYGYGAQYSFAQCVTFVKTGTIDEASGSDGYFLLGTNGGTNNIESAPSDRSKNEIWRSVDGISWQSVRQSDSGFPVAMTQINKNANLENVIYV